MNYTIIVKPSAQKDLDNLPFKDVKLLSKRLDSLKQNPRPVGIQKLTDAEGYRLRSGKYRILFIIDDKRKSIFIFRVKHRKDAYK